MVLTNRSKIKFYNFTIHLMEYNKILHRAHAESDNNGVVILPSKTFVTQQEAISDIVDTIKEQIQLKELKNALSTLR